MQELDSEGLGSHLCRTAATLNGLVVTGFFGPDMRVACAMRMLSAGVVCLVIRLLSWLSVSVSRTFICKVVVVPTP